MRLVSDNRASRILFNFLSSNRFEKPFVVPLNVCEVIPLVFQESGTRVVFADVNEESLCLDFKQLFSNLDMFSGMLFVHTYGTERSFESLFLEIKRSASDFIIIDDRCLCMPSLSTPDTVADICLYSVGEKKQVDLGCGGYAFMQDYLKYSYSPLKTGSFLYDNPWVLNQELLVQKTVESVSQRECLNDIYRELLPYQIQFKEEFQNWRFNIRVSNKDRVLDALFSDGLFASSHYRPISPLGGPSNSAWLFDHVINLFNDSHFTVEMAERTCKIINRLL